MRMIDQEQRRKILRDLDDVGHRKAVGYLPLYTVRDFLHMPISKFRNRYSRTGLCVVVFSASRCRIKSGAVYVYDEKSVKEITETFREAVGDQGWDASPRAVISRIAHQWLEDAHPLKPFVDALFKAPLDRSRYYGELEFALNELKPNAPE